MANALAVRVICVIVGIIVTAVAFRLVKQNDVQLSVLYSVKFNDTQVRNATEFRLQSLPGIISLISTVCGAVQIFVSLETAVWIRQTDWALTVPMMIALISTLSGVRDVWLVAAQALLALFMILSGTFSYLIDGPGRWVAFTAGSVAMVFVWTVIIWHFHQTDAPHQIGGVIISQVLMFLGYPFFEILRETCKLTTETLEVLFLVWGLLTKTVLALIITFGVAKTAQES